MMVHHTTYYVKLGVYNYDAYPRHQIVLHYCGSEMEARILSKSFSCINDPGKESFNEWLDKNHGISGFITRIYGVYVEVTSELED